MKKIAKHFVPNPGTLLIVGLFLLAQSVVGSPSVPLLTQAPSATLISYQGRLSDAGSTPLTGDYQMQFALYGVPTGGSACWRETQTVSVSDGLFNVLLGSVSAIDPLCLAGDVYLGITVGSDSEMTPRELLTSVPHAVEASTVPDGSITSEKLNLVDGRVGIGTAAPQTKLHVVADATTSHAIKGQAGASGSFGGLFYGNDESTEVLLGGSTYAALFNDGNVGIGTADPKSALDVAGTLSVNDRINLIRNGSYATIETDSAGGGSGATRLYFYGYDANENRTRTAMFDGNGHAKFYGHLSVLGEVYTPRLNSPQNTDLMIDAGYQSHNNLSLNDDVSIPNGNLDMVDHQIKDVSRISSSGDMTIDAGDGPRRTLTLQDDVRLPDGNLTVEGDGTSKIEANLQVGNNTASPSFAGLDGNDMYVDVQFQQAGSGGARLYKVGGGRGAEVDVGTLAVGSHAGIPARNPQQQDADNQKQRKPPMTCWKLAAVCAATLVLCNSALAADEPVRRFRAKDVFAYGHVILFQDDFQSGQFGKWNFSEDER